MDRPDVDAIEGRAAEANAGPWTVEQDWTFEIHDAEGRIVAKSPLSSNHDGLTPRFIAAARTDLPELVAHVRHLESEMRIRADRTAASVALLAAAEHEQAERAEKAEARVAELEASQESAVEQWLLAHERGETKPGASRTIIHRIIESAVAEAEADAVRMEIRAEKAEAEVARLLGIAQRVPWATMEMLAMHAPITLLRELQREFVATPPTDSVP